MASSPVPLALFSRVSKDCPNCQRTLVNLFTAFDIVVHSSTSQMVDFSWGDEWRNFFSLGFYDMVPSSFTWVKVVWPLSGFFFFLFFFFFFFAWLLHFGFPHLGRMMDIEGILIVYYCVPSSALQVLELQFFTTITWGIFFFSVSFLEEKSRTWERI